MRRRALAHCIKVPREDEYFRHPHSTEILSSSTSSRTHSFTRIEDMASTSRPSQTNPHFSTVSLDSSANFGSNFPQLLTRYVPGPECKDRWVLPSSSGTVVSVYSTKPGTDSPSDILYTPCLPLSHTGYYSPGVCPQDYTLADVLEKQYSSDGRLVRIWDGNCCRR